jgi:hypothetical protein
MTEAYANQNGAILAKNGLPVTPGSTYLAHFAGPQGAVKIMQSDPTAMAGDILGPAVVKANPFLANMTAADLQAWASRKMGGSAPQPQPSPASPAAPPSAPSTAAHGGAHSALRRPITTHSAAGHADLPARRTTGPAAGRTRLLLSNAGPTGPVADLSKAAASRSQQTQGVLAGAYFFATRIINGPAIL